MAPEERRREVGLSLASLAVVALGAALLLPAWWATTRPARAPLPTAALQGLARRLTSEPLVPRVAVAVQSLTCDGGNASGMTSVTWRMAEGLAADLANRGATVTLARSTACAAVLGDLRVQRSNSSSPPHHYAVIVVPAHVANTHALLADGWCGGLPVQAFGRSLVARPGPDVPAALASLVFPSGTEDALLGATTETDVHVAVTVLLGGLLARDTRAALQRLTEELQAHSKRLWPLYNLTVSSEVHQLVPLSPDFFDPQAQRTRGTEARLRDLTTTFLNFRASHVTLDMVLLVPDGSVPDHGGGHSVLATDQSAIFLLPAQEVISSCAAAVQTQLHGLLGIAEQGALACDAWPAGMRSDLLALAVERSQRARFEARVQRGVGTLGSLSNLLGRIPTMVVSAELGDKFTGAVEHLSAAVEACHSGVFTPQAFAQAALGSRLADEAFFDHKVLALLYFPDDQTYAIYLPFFAPVGVALLIRARALLQAARAERGS